MRFTPEELRRAIVALNTIEQYGDRHEWDHIRYTAFQDAAPPDRPWHYATGNQSIGGRMLADRLADLLGASREQCELAAAEVFTKQLHRAVYDALMSYADELTAKPTRPAVQPTPAPQATRPVTTNIRRKPR